MIVIETDRHTKSHTAAAVLTVTGQQARELMAPTRKAEQRASLRTRAHERFSLAHMTSERGEPYEDTGDRLFSRSPEDTGNMGYGPPRLLGCVHLTAPLTGETAQRPLPVSWAHRFGAVPRAT
jgi:hypothetical protein